MKKLSFVIFIAVLFISCSAGSRQSGEESVVRNGAYPDMILENTQCSVMKSDGSPITLKAGRMTLYSADGYALLENFSFESYSENGSIETTGQAEEGKVELDGERLELKGGVSFSRPQDGMHVTAESLVYDRADDIIRADGDVTVSSDEGTIRGQDFRGDLRNSSYSFSCIKEGDFELQ